LVGSKIAVDNKFDLRYSIFSCFALNSDELVKSPIFPIFVIPAEAGIQSIQLIMDAGSSPA